MSNQRRSNLSKYGTPFPRRDLGVDSRRANFGLGTMHREGDDGPIENAIDKTGGDSTAWTSEDHRVLDERMMADEKHFSRTGSHEW